MSLVSNYIGAISPSQFTQNPSVAEFDLNDTTFFNLLDKQMQKIDSGTNNHVSLLNGLGIPSELQILKIDEAMPIEQAETVGEKLQTQTDNSPLAEDETTSSEFLTFFPSLMNTPIKSSDSGLMDFARKQAANFYGKYSQNVITNVSEFVEDIQSLIKQ